MQYSSTSCRSLPLKRMPTSCSKTAATWCGLRGSTDRRSGSGGLSVGVVPVGVLPAGVFSAVVFMARIVPRAAHLLLLLRLQHGRHLLVDQVQALQRTDQHLEVGDLAGFVP